MKTKTLKVSREFMYVLGMIVLPFAVALMTKANLGLSQIASPSYIISQKFNFITQGQTEYIYQTVVLILMCVIIKKFKLIYLSSFITAIIYGSVLDFYLWLMSGWDVTQLWFRLLLFVFGLFFTAFGVAFFMNTYLAPCAYDYFVRTVVNDKKLDLRKFKLGFDVVFLALSVVLTLTLHHKFIGVTWFTLVIVSVNSTIISWATKLIQN